MTEPLHHIETEAKLYVPHLEIVQARLETLGAMLTAPRVHEWNVRYENAAQTLTRDHIVVRLRKDTRTRLTYKEGSSIDSGIVSRTEIEVEVNDFDAMEAMLAKLGYTPHTTYEKYRTTYELDETEITLDEMPFGSFIEIEGEKTAIRLLIERLELDDAPRMEGGYLDLFEQVKSNLGLAFHDLTFANFNGVNVPAEAFYS